jgi:putative DNA primase/helicase
VRWVAPWKSYVVYDGTRWLIDEEKTVVERAKATVKGIYREAAYAETDEERKALTKHALKSEAAARIAAMLELAESEKGIPIAADAFDADPWLLNVANGTIDLRTGELRPHRAADLITKTLPVTYDPAATCPRWTAFLDEIMAGNADLVRFLQQAIGYALTGDTREQVFFILLGVGANGKSVFLKVVETMLGDYARQASMDTFMQKEYQGIPNDIARLHGVRFVAASEAEQNRRLAEALVKSLTGGDPVVARFLHKEFFTFTPRFKIFLATNHKPIIRGSEHAIWRRIRLVPFTVTIPEERQDKDLVTKLVEELPGILTWAIEGCRRWQQEGLKSPDAVKVATEEYRTEMDTLGSFIADRCDVGPMCTATASSLYAAYQAWAKEGREREMSQTMFGRALRERGFEADRTGGRGRFWTGLAVRASTSNGASSDAAPSTREPGDEGESVPF